jgi:cellulose/xylan binding protein with CBM9 domain
MPEPTIAAPFSSRNLSAGDFDHAEWLRSDPVTIAHRWNGQNAPASRHAQARIMWTREALLVRFVCRQEEPLVVNSTPQFEKKTPGLWYQDVCEIFVAPDPNVPGRYFEFEVSPLGEWIDLAINHLPDHRETNFEFLSGMTAASRISEGEFVVAMSIPWSESLPCPEVGDVWRVNLFRCVGAGDERYLAWQPTYAPEPNFHVPEVFGRLEFVA